MFNIVVAYGVKEGVERVVKEVSPRVFLEVYPYTEIEKFEDLFVKKYGHEKYGQFKDSVELKEPSSSDNYWLFERCGSMFFDHKIPDFASFPPFFMDSGAIISFPSPYKVCVRVCKKDEGKASLC